MMDLVETEEDLDRVMIEVGRTEMLSDNKNCTFILLKVVTTVVKLVI